MSLVGHCAHEHMLLIFSPCFGLQYLPFYRQYKIFGFCFNVFVFHFDSMAALHVLLPSAESGDRCYLLKYSESGIASFPYGTHTARTENGRTYQIDVYFLPFQDSALSNICQRFIQFL